MSDIQIFISSQMIFVIVGRCSKCSSICMSACSILHIETIFCLNTGNVINYYTNVSLTVSVTYIRELL